MDDPATMNDGFTYRATFKVKKMLRLPGSGAATVSPLFYNEAPVFRWAQQSVSPVEAVDVVCSSGSSVEKYEITLPASMQIISLPEGTAFSSALLGYEATYRVDGRTLIARRSVEDRTVPPICSKETMEAFRMATEGVMADVRQQLVYK